MKRLSKIISVVLALALLLSVTALAGAGEERLELSFEGINARYDGAFAPKLGGARYFSGTFNFYDQLSTFQKHVYDCVKAMTPGQTVLQIQYDFYPGTANDCFAEAEGGVFAVFKDCPEFFWLTGSYGGNISYNTTSGGIGSVTLTLTFSDCPGYPDPAAAKVQLDAAIASFTVPDGSRYDMLRYIHDEIAGMVTYSPCVIQNSHSSDSYCNYCVYAYQAAGVFFKYYSQTVSYAVCEGYSEAFKLICDKYEIPCVLVISTDHMWNVVRMDDNKWYAIDVTWDDQESMTYEDFFLVGSTSVPTYFNKVTFEQSHPPYGYFSTSENKLFTFPTLASTKYTFPTGLYFSDSGEADYSLRHLLLSSVSTIRLSGTGVTLTPTAAGTGTGSTFSDGSNTWTLAVRGDVTGDGAVTGDDFSAVLDASVGKPGKMTAGSVYLEAGDVVNTDGVIDACDAMAVELARSGHLTF